MIAQFALRLVCGMSLMWAVMPRARVTSGFFRIQMLVTLGLSVLAMLNIADPPMIAPVNVSVVIRWLCGGLALASFLGSVVWTLERRNAGAAFVFLILGLSITALLLQACVPLLGWTDLLCSLAELSSAAVLGGALTSMLLGHWYLTAPTMSIAPLSRLNLFFGCALVFRLLIAATGLALAWSELGGQIHVIWLSLRWLAGILGPLVLCWMVWRILAYRNTQAATGVLFAAVILTFIGELTAVLLYNELSVPV